MITREQVADLRPGDVVEIRHKEFGDATIRGAVHSTEGLAEALYLGNGQIRVRTRAGEPSADVTSLTVIERAPRLLHNCPDCTHTEVRVGDEWTASDDWYSAGGGFCQERTPDADRLVCCRDNGHPSPHIAGDGHRVLAVWP